MTNKNTDINENETVTGGVYINSGLSLGTAIDWNYNGGYTINAPNTINSKMVYPGNDTYFKDYNGVETSVNNILERLNKIEERLCIIDKLTDKESVMLKNAYDEYKFVEKLIGKYNDSSES